MSLKTLLLNHNYEVHSFIGEKNVLKLILREKAEIISFWDDLYLFDNVEFKYPSVVRLKRLIKRPDKIVHFSRKSVLRRDAYICQYCGVNQTVRRMTVDHIVPRIYGGENSFLNCVCSCFVCNNKKGGRTPEQAGMKLIRKPFAPTLSALQSQDISDEWHEDWRFFLRL